MNAFQSLTLGFIMLALSCNYIKGHTTKKTTTQKITNSNADNISNQFSQTGLATYYGKKMNGRRTASGEKLYNESYVCAHRTLPFGTMLNVYCPKTDKTVKVRVIDRGPFIKGRIIDLSWAAARDLGIIAHGTSKVVISQCPKTEEEPQKQDSSIVNIP